jgi:hypothetical protein
MSGEPGAGAAALGCLVAAPGPSLQRRIDIYLETVRQKTLQRLRVSFARVAKLAGDEAFARLVEAHVRACPPAQRTPEDLMASLPAFLMATPQTRRADLGDLARLELARSDVAMEASGEPATFAGLAAMGPACGKAKLTLAPALRLVDLAYDVLPVWQGLEDAGPLPEPIAAATRLLVWRNGLAVFHARVDAEEGAALERALAGATLNEICAAFASRHDAEDAAYTALYGWFARGLVVGVQP